MANGNTHGEKSSQPILNRWDCVSFTIKKFLNRREGFCKLGKDATSKEKRKSE